jgi:hypothetical protein
MTATRENIEEMSPDEFEGEVILQNFKKVFKEIPCCVKDGRVVVDG